MKWTQVEIIDNDGAPVADPEGFVGRYAPELKVSSYRRGRFALKKKGSGNKKAVDPNEVQALLRNALAGQARSVTVAGAAAVSNVVVPARHTTNVVNVQPQYRITLELGDVDALFGPLEIPAARERPWDHAGVRQRLQVLGYLYTALPHSQILDHAEKCWRYYAMVHSDRNSPEVTTDEENEQLLATLQREVRGNIVMDHLPDSGEVGPASVFPALDAFAAIRVPGAYCMTWPRTGMRDDSPRPTDADQPFDHTLVEDQHKLEESIVSKNPLLFKLPVVAKVEIVKSDGQTEPAGNVTVHFQLIEPAPIPDDHPLNATPLRDTVLDIGKDWVAGDIEAYTPPTSIPGERPAPPPPPPGGGGPPPPPPPTANVTPSADDWAAAKANFAATYQRPAGERDAHVDSLPIEPNAKLALRFLLNNNSNRTLRELRNNQPPYEIQGRGQRLFVRDLINRVVARHNDDTDPQRTNAPADWCGRAGEPVETNLFPIADPTDEVANAPVNLQARIRAHGGPDTEMPRPEAIADAVDPHRHAVKTLTNAHGQAGVIFSPSFCGGDRYRLRAYIGPDSWTSTTATPPEACTGTLVVWRNIRLYRYYKKADVNLDAMRLSNDMRELLEWPAVLGHDGGYHGKLSWNTAFAATKSNSASGTVGFGRGSCGEGVYERTPRPKNDGFKRSYRPVDVDFPGFAEVFAQCFCEWIMDATGPTEVTDELHAEAIRRGKEAAAGSGAVSVDVDWDTLIFHDMNSPFVVNIRHYLHYNHLISSRGDTATYPELTNNQEAEIKAALEPLFINTMLSVYAGGGAYPGLTLVQFPRGDTWHHNILSGAAVFTSGVAGPVRAAFVFFSDALYRSEEMCYSLTSNSIHELGHVLMGEHQFGDALKHQGLPDSFTTPTPDQVPCIMSYHGCYGEFCGKCIMRMRGWKIKSDSENEGV